MFVCVWRTLIRGRCGVGGTATAGADDKELGVESMTPAADDVADAKEGSEPYAGGRSGAQRAGIGDGLSSVGFWTMFAGKDKVRRVQPGKRTRHGRIGRGESERRLFKSSDYAGTMGRSRPAK